MLTQCTMNRPSLELTAFNPFEAATWRIASDGSWVECPDGERHELAGRKAIPEVLGMLATLRAEKPGESVSTQELVEAGWPGERMRWSSALNRLRVAMCAIRKCGLSDAVESLRGSYRLSPNVAIEVVTSDEPARVAA